VSILNKTCAIKARDFCQIWHQASRCLATGPQFYRLIKFPWAHASWTARRICSFQCM